MKMATVNDVIRMFAMLLTWGAKNGPDLSGEGRTEAERNESEAQKVMRVATAWHALLDDLTAEELTLAAKAHARGSTWWPSPAEIRAQVPRLMRGAMALEVADAETGWDRWPEVVRQAGSIGPREDWLEELGKRTGIQDLRRLETAIRDCGGWKAIRMLDHPAAKVNAGKRFAASWDRWAQATSKGLLQNGQNRALGGAGSDDGTVVDIRAELERRKALGGSHGR
jgi:hypothetical protein